MAGMENPNLTNGMNRVFERAVLLPGIHEQLEYDEALGFLTLPTASSTPDAVTIVGFNVRNDTTWPKQPRLEGTAAPAAPGAPATPEFWYPNVIPKGADKLEANELWRLTNKGGVPDERIYSWPKAVAGRAEDEAQYGDLVILRASMYRESIKRVGVFGAAGRLMLNGYRRTRTPSPNDSTEAHEAYLKKVNRQYGEDRDVAIVPQTLAGRRTQLMRRALSPRGVPSAFAVLLNGALEVNVIGSVGAYGKARTERRHERHKRADSRIG